MMVYFEGTWAGCEVFEKYVSILDNPPDDEVLIELLRNIWAELKILLCLKTQSYELSFKNLLKNLPLWLLDSADLCV